VEDTLSCMGKGCMRRKTLRNTVLYRTHKSTNKLEKNVSKTNLNEET